MVTEFKELFNHKKAIIRKFLDYKNSYILRHKWTTKTHYYYQIPALLCVGT
jgi:hypothetical protein